MARCERHSDPRLNPAVIRHLIAELLSSLAPAATVAMVRRDAAVWHDLLASISGI